MKFLKVNRFNQGILCNYVSLGIMALSGFAFNIIILRYYDAAALGLFNQVYAWYMVLSQVASLGIHTSVLSYLSTDREQHEQGTILKSAILLTIFLGFVMVCVAEIALCFLLSAGDLLSKSLKIVLPGLIFFSINKVLLNCCNATNHMVLYAVFQSLRYILIAIIIVILSFLDLEPYFLPLAFPMAEVVLLAFLFPYIMYNIGLNGCISIDWIITHFKFGIRVFPANMVLELNSKIDVLCLGILLKNDYIVGIYSFASLFTSGMYEAYVVIRRSINPALAKENNSMLLQIAIRMIFKKLKVYLYFLLPTLCLAALIFYAMLYHIMDLGQEYILGCWIIFIIGLSIIFTGKMIVLGNIFSQTKHPKIESLINVLTVLVNLLCNIVLILIFGVLGAAIGTAISYLFFGIALKGFCRNVLDIAA